MDPELDPLLVELPPLAQPLLSRLRFVSPPPESSDESGVEMLTDEQPAAPDVEPEELLVIGDVNGFTSPPPLAEDISQVKAAAESCMPIPAFKSFELID